MIQPEITARDDKIKARRKQYLQHLRDGFSVCEGGKGRGVWTERLLLCLPPLLLSTLLCLDCKGIIG